MTTPRQLKDLYEQGRNICEFLRKEMCVERNTQEIIEIAYDLQTGSYNSFVQDGDMAIRQDECSKEIAAVIQALCKPVSVLEAGVGEATTLSGVLKHLGGVSSYGFDLSWSRVALGKKRLHSKGITSNVLCSGDLLNIPFLDNSIDVVYTLHSIEPNGGSEEPILRELYRVARKYLVLIEPGYEFASDEERRRMEHHNYCKNLNGISLSLGYDVLENRPFDFTISHPLNPSALTIIRKNNDGEFPFSNVLACPKYKTPLKEVGGSLFSPEALVVYPTIGGIPCLRIENGIFASKYEEFVEAG
jgi:ubiquinone/menaquinone biosynthesis C-methylase UbiE/uncharacterized protein YbaR (Trm112 family)